MHIMHPDLLKIMLFGSPHMHPVPSHGFAQGDKGVAGCRCLQFLLIATWSELEFLLQKFIKISKLFIVQIYCLFCIFLFDSTFFVADLEIGAPLKWCFLPDYSLPLFPPVPGIGYWIMPEMPGFKTCTACSCSFSISDEHQHFL